MARQYRSGREEQVDRRRHRGRSAEIGLPQFVQEFQARAGNVATGRLVAGLHERERPSVHVLARTPDGPTTVPGPDAPVDLAAGDPAPRAPDDPGHLVSRATEARGIVEDELLPAFHAAVDAVDPAAAYELAAALVQLVRGARRDVEEAAAAIGLDGGDAFAWEQAALEGVEPEPLDWERQAVLEVDVDLELEDQSRLDARLAFELGPRVFRGSVVSDVAVPSGQRSLEAAAREAAVTIELLNTVKAVRALFAASEASSLQAAADLVEGWRGRPVNFLFLYAALEAEGLLAPLMFMPGGETGRNIVQLRGQAQESARHFGALVDVGAFELDEAVELLSYYGDDWAITDEDAEKVFRMWASASPEARVAILEKLEAEGRLERLCSNLPGLAVRAMGDVANVRGGSSPAANTLRAAIADQPGGETATELYEEQIMENIEEDQLVRAYLWTLLNVSHSALTLGFKDIHDTAYVDMREGRISADEYWSTTTKAAGRTAVILAATAVTGGVAGGFAEGLALGRGVGATASALIGGGVGGATSGAAGKLTEDLFDQALMGKEGFSSAEEYLIATGAGAASGTVLAGAGVAAGRMFRGSAERTLLYHSGGGRYRVLQDFRQGLHRQLYNAYRGSVRAGRGAGASEDPALIDLTTPERRAHILEGEGSAQGGHAWPPNPEGGVGGGPKTPFPREWNDDLIIDVVSDITRDPLTIWTQQTGPGQGSQVHGLPDNPPTTNAGAPVRYRADVVRDGITIRVIAEPGGEGIVSAFPVGFEDPANLLQFVRPDAAPQPDEELSPAPPP